MKANAQIDENGDRLEGKTTCRNTKVKSAFRYYLYFFNLKIKENKLIIWNNLLDKKIQPVFNLYQRHQTDQGWVQLKM